MPRHRDPVDRVIDAIVAVPVACATALRQLIPIGTTRLERRVGNDLEQLYRYARRRARPRPGPTAAGRGDGVGRVAPLGGPARGVDRARADDEGPPDGLADATLAIDGYDQLSARQVVDRLADLTTEELAAVERHEQGGRRRQTILHRIAQLT